MDVAFRVLGPAEIVVDGRPAALQGGRTRGLLAALLLHEGRVVPAAALIDLIWDGAAPKTAANQLQIAVHRLRAALSAAGLGGRLGTRDGGYLLDLPAGTRVDLHDFRALAAQAAARAAAGDWTAARDTGRDALALWRGPAWDGLAADGPRRAAEAERLTAVEVTQAAELVLGDRAAPVAELRALVAEHPYHQRFWYLLILALALRGRPAEALEAHAAARERHQRDLGTGLGPEIAALERAVLRGEPHSAVDAVRAWTFGVAVPPAPGGLPADLHDFTGRAAEGDHVAAILRANPSHRHPAVIVVAGLGGIGKTAFAVRTAHRNAGLFPDGPLFVDLRGFDDVPKDTHAVMGDLLHAMGVAGQAVPDDPDARLGVYRSVMAGRQVLLVLDNAASEAQVRPLLPVNPASAAIVTSRRLLAGLDGAFVVELDVLSPPEALGMLTGIHRGGGRGTDPAALGRIAELTGRHPLALRILGSRTARLCGGDLTAVLARLADEGARLDELSDGDRPVRQTIGFSYGDLGPQAARLLRLAALLPAPRFGAEVAAALLDVDVFDAEEVLDELADAQLVRPVSAPGDLGVRYVMHDLVRVYARERGPDEDADTALSRVHRLLLVLAHHADAALGHRHFPTPPLTGHLSAAAPANLTAVRADPDLWFEEERDLIFAVIAAADTETAWRLLAATVNFLDLRAQFAAATALIDAMLAREPGDEGTAAMLLARTRNHGVLGEMRAGIRTAVRAGRLYQKLGDPVRAAASATLLAVLARFLGRPRAARTAGRHAVDMLRAADPADPTVAVQLGWALHYSGEWQLNHGSVEEAARLFAEAAAVLEDAGDLSGAGYAGCGLSLSFYERGDADGGIAHAERSLSLLRAVGNRSDRITAHGILAEGHLLAGRPEQARALLAAEVNEVRRLHRPTLVHLTMLRLGRALFALERHAEARDAFAEAGAVLEEHAMLASHGTALIWHARTLAALGELAGARESAARARTIHHGLNVSGAEAEEVLAEIETLAGRPTGSS